MKRVFSSVKGGNKKLWMYSSLGSNSIKKWMWFMLSSVWGHVVPKFVDYFIVYSNVKILLIA